MDVEKHTEEVLSSLKEGDVITHTRCMGCIEEHVYTRMKGKWICGIPTRDTMQISGIKRRRKGIETDDISPRNVTHINRVPVDRVKFLAVSIGLYK